jgi:hypothetical protein
MSEFITLTQDEQDDQIVSFYANQERDKNSLEINIARYQLMLPGLPEGAFKSRIQSLLSQSQERLVEISAIMAATELQLPAQERLQASLARLQSKGAIA